MGIKTKYILHKVSQEMGFICPEYITIKSQITREINIQLPREQSFDEFLDESKYYKIKEMKIL